MHQQLATIHARAFTTARPWKAEEFKVLLKSPHCFVSVDSHETISAFALGRVIADEAELLTLATDPALRRRGHARKCLYQFEKAAKNAGAATAFLEVAEDNTAAITLYQNAGYHIVARRTAYYNRKQGAAIDALVMRRNFVE
ncbi:MAG: ribosomal protein S18-alanine N-acetyltransferase [Rhodobacterales bacterium]|nr:ribosomal protein S18-alanine N-acetyltransferase [Rhodobacterales bacterium]